MAHAEVKDVFLAVSRGETVIETEADGFLTTQLNPGDTATMRIVVGSRKSLMPFVVRRTGQGQFQRFRDIGTDEESVFEFKVPIVKSEKGVTITVAYPDNQCHLVVRGVGGFFRLIQVSLVSQEGQFFLRLQQMYVGQAWKDEAGNFHVGNDEEFKSWQYLLPTLREEMERQKLQSTPPPAPAALTVPTEPNLAVVKWYGDSTGFGFVLTSDGQELKVHWSRIASSDRFSHLRTGWVIRYERVVIRPGARGHHKGQDRPELDEVTIVSRG